ncbi:transposase [Sphingobacterium sp. lm-10]|uniref:transposase n=1 Tax=Sphingobacterium sp. lm-10 TaxID=2944904 RepID=UPI00201FB48E|nr:transposase [Sphingobacterium sp. lm-10]MCL7989104.1 transposase [Sphingobacterium sp. lm-10]
MNRTFSFVASLGVATVLMTACQNSENKQSDNNTNPESLSAKAIEVHDEIMPQISKFDKTSVKIDSILNGLSTLKAEDPALDTAAIRTELTALKQDIESATDGMMDWMRNYSLKNNDIAYQESELERITLMRAQFDKVNKEIESKMKTYAK